MKILVILGHPEKSSFNHALAGTCCEQLISNGHTVYFHDLYVEQFNPVLQLTHTLSTDSDIEILDKHISDLQNSDGIIIIHPNWWGQPPAIVKGWIDRVLLPDVAYKFEESPNGEHIPVGLLKAKTGLVFNTSNTPEEIETQVFKDALETLWEKRVFLFCGVKQFERKNFSIVKDSDETIRKKWLLETKQTIDQYFPREPIV